MAKIQINITENPDRRRGWYTDRGGEEFEVIGYQEDYFGDDMVVVDLSNDDLTYTKRGFVREADTEAVTDSSNAEADE